MKQFRKSTIALQASQPSCGSFMRGFTLIEILVVVGIVGILASIAYPSYTDHVRKTRRTDAQTELLDMASRMERYYANRSTYIGADAQFSPGNTEHGYYSISIAETATSYALSAAPANAQASDECGTLTLNSQGVKGAALSAVECW